MNEKRPKLIIFADQKKNNVSEAVSEFLEFVKGKADIVDNCDVRSFSPEVAKGCDYSVVFGGDGSIIAAARTLSDSRVPVIGVNLGKLGFLAEFNVGELKKYFEHVVTGKADIERRMMLNCRVLRSGRQIFSSKAINDIFITAGPPFRVIELQIKVNDQLLASCVSDGLIISTPTGSTAYNLSSGGPILSGKMEAMVVTPICPHSLSFRPIVISADSQVEIVGLQVNKGTTVSIDGQLSQELSAEDVVKVEKDKSSFFVVNNPIRNQWDTLAAKLGWAEKPKYTLKGNKFPRP